MNIDNKLCSFTLQVGTSVKHRNFHRSKRCFDNREIFPDTKSGQLETQHFLDLDQNDRESANYWLCNSTTTNQFYICIKCLLMDCAIHVIFVIFLVVNVGIVLCWHTSLNDMSASTLEKCWSCRLERFCLPDPARWHDISW